MSDAVDTVVIVLLIVNLIGLLRVAVHISAQSTENRQMWGRLITVEGRVDNLPTHRDLTELRSDISEVVEAVATLSGQSTAMTQMLRTIQEHLLESDR